MTKALTIADKLAPVTKALKGSYSAVGTYFERADQQVDQAERLSDPSRPLRLGIALILFTFLGIGIWVALAPLDSAALAPGVIVAESNRRVIQHLEGGIVSEILVQDGTKVNAGDVLVRLDDTRARASMAILQTDQDTNTAILCRLTAERDGLSAPVFPEDMIRRAATDPAVASIMRAQTDLFNSRRNSLSNQESILEQRVEQYKEQIVGLRALQKSKEIQLDAIRDELNDLKGLLASGYVTKTRVLALEREAARLAGEAGDHISAVARSEQGIGETKLQLLQLQKSRMEEINRETQDTQARISEGRDKLVAARDVMKRVDVVSPVAGTVMSMQLHTVGGIVAPGAGMMEIVPANDAMVIEAQISPIDIDTVHPGQKVGLHIAAADTRLVPVIYGVLENVSADRYIDQRIGQPYYKARISIPQSEIDRMGDGHNLHTGMTVEAMIIRGQQSALSYIARPLIEAFEKAFKDL